MNNVFMWQKLNEVMSTFLQIVHKVMSTFWQLYVHLIMTSCTQINW